MQSQPHQSDSRGQRPKRTRWERISRKVDRFLMKYRGLLGAVALLLGLYLFLSFTARRPVEEPGQIETATHVQASDLADSARLADLQRQQETEELLRSADTDTLLKHLRSLKNQAFPPEKASSHYSELSQIIGHLNRGSLSAEQRLTLKILEIEIALWTYEVKDKHDLGIENPETNVLDVANRLAGDQDPEVSAVAHAALMGVEAIDLRVEGSEQNFLQFIDGYRSHVSYAMQGEEGAKFVGMLLPSITRLNPGDKRCLSLLEDYVSRAGDSSSASVQKLGVDFKERMYFNREQLQTLVQHLKISGKPAMPAVDQLFDRLKQHPDVSPYVFRQSLAVIEALIENQNLRSAETAIEKFRVIEPTIVDTDSRDLVGSQLTKYENNLAYHQTQE